MSHVNIPPELEKGLKSVQKGMSKLNKGIAKLQSDGNADEFSSEYMHLHKTIYDLSTQRSPHNFSRHLYDRYTECLQQYITSQVLPSFSQKAGEFLLREVVNQWENYKLTVSHLSSLFSCLHIFIRYNRLPTLNEVALRCFHNSVCNDFLCGSVRDAMIVQINRERGGERIDAPALLKNVVAFYLEFGTDFYESSFESAMMEGTTCYYSRMALSWISDYSCTAYMLKAEECLNLEKMKIARYYLHPTSEKKLLERVETELLVKYESNILDCFPVFLRDEKVDDLSRTFRLFSSTDKRLKKLAQIFRHHIASKGISLVKHAVQQLGEAENAVNKKAIVAVAQEQFARNAIRLYEKYFQYVEEIFMNNTTLRQSFREVFEDFCNKIVAGSSIGEIFIAFCDTVLRNKNLSYGDVEDTLEKIVKILACVNDKDMVAEFYKKKLANRLLNLPHKNENVDREKGMLSKLKIEYGIPFTYKMEGMLTDLTSTMNTQSRFDHYLKENSLNPHLGIGFSVKLLTTGYWPSYNSLDTMFCPIEITRCVEVFQEFYTRDKVDRRLKWIYSQGSCEMIGRFESREIELSASPWQTCALLLFNASERLAYSDVKSRLNLTDTDTVRLLQSLACNSKYKILNKIPNTQTVTQTDYFEFNAKIGNKVRKIKIPAPAAQEREKLSEDVDKARSLQIEASIVKIMKSKKVLHHSNLVTQCIEQLKHMFIPDKKIIKKRVEDLITKDYLERDTENPNIYRYIA